MSTITIQRNHDLGQSQCEQALEDLTAYLEELGATVCQRASTLTFQGRGFDGEVEISPGIAKGRIKLGLLARPFRKQLESEITRHLDARLGPKAS